MMNFHNPTERSKQVGRLSVFWGSSGVLCLFVFEDRDEASASSSVVIAVLDPEKFVGPPSLFLVT